MLETDIFVPIDQEERYLSDHHLQRIYLPNGAVIFAGTREVDDAAYADLELEFPRGSISDPPHKQGLVHIFEHLIANAPGKISRESDTRFNASTAFTTLGIQLSGIANPKVLKYGIWPVLPAIFRGIRATKVDQQELEREKNIILEEVAGRVGDSSCAAWEHLMSVVYDPKNPTSHIREADQAQVKNVTLEDIKTLSGKILHPNGLIARIGVEGSKKITDALVRDFEENLSRIPDKGEPLPEYDLACFDALNPATHPGQIYLKDPGIKDGLVTVYYTWIGEVVPFSPQTFAETSFFNAFQNRAFSHLRKKGLAYYCQGIQYTPNETGKNKIFAVQLTLNKTGRIKNKIGLISSQLRDSVLSKFTQDDLRDVRIRGKRSTLATPISTSRRLRDCIQGFRLFNRRIINPEKVDQIFGQISLKQIKIAQEKLLDTPPVIVVSGDLN